MESRARHPRGTDIPSIDGQISQRIGKTVRGGTETGVNNSQDVSVLVNFVGGDARRVRKSGTKRSYYERT